MKGRFITITDEQDEFIRREPQDFKLSKFIRAKLDDYIKLKEELKNEKKI